MPRSDRDLPPDAAILLEEYRVLYQLVVFRMTSLERRVPIAAGALALLLAGVANLPAPAMIAIIAVLPLPLFWYLETTIMHARSFEDLALAVFAATGKPSKIAYIDMPAEIRDRYQYFTEARMERVRAAGYAKPFTTLEEGVARYVRDFLSAADPYR